MGRSSAAWPLSPPCNWVAQLLIFHQVRLLFAIIHPPDLKSRGNLCPAPTGTDLLLPRVSPVPSLEIWGQGSSFFWRERKRWRYFGLAYATTDSNKGFTRRSPAGDGHDKMGARILLEVRAYLSGQAGLLSACLHWATDIVGGSDYPHAPGASNAPGPTTAAVARIL